MLSRKFIRDICIPFLGALGSPQAQLCAALIEREDWDSLVSLTTDPAHYEDAEMYFRDALATSFLRKCVDVETSFDKTERTLKNWFDAERHCRSINRKFDLIRLITDYPVSSSDAALAKKISRLKRWLSKFLGPIPETLADGRFGPGATYQDKGIEITPIHKLSAIPTLHPEGFCLLDNSFYGTSWGRSLLRRNRSLPKLVLGSRWSEVPKTGLINRDIDIQPSLTGFFQRSIGLYQRARLKRFRIDLKEGQSAHRQVARWGSLTGSFATIDLRNASNSIARNWLYFMPADWAELLSTTRCSQTLINGVWWSLSKLSAMGNGFTFEIETTIFLAICCCAMEDSGVIPEPGANLFVYGDDIIVPTECAKTVLEALTFFGFEPNASKTHIDGPFRESCGGDFFNGVDVRPHYLEKEPCSPNEWFGLANAIFRISKFWGGLDKSPLRKVWFKVIDQLPSDLRFARGPESLGDVVIHDKEELWPHYAYNGIRLFKAVIPQPSYHDPNLWSKSYPDVQMAYALYCAQSSGSGFASPAFNPDKIPIRGQVHGYVRDWVECSDGEQIAPLHEYQVGFYSWLFSRENPRARVRRGRFGEYFYPR